MNKKWLLATAACAMFVGGVWQWSAGTPVPVFVATTDDTAATATVGVINAEGKLEVDAKELDPSIAAKIAELFKGKRSIVERPRDGGLIGSYLSARHATLHNDSMNATRYFGATLRHAPEDLTITQQALQSYLVTGDYARAKELASGMLAQENKSQLALMLLLCDALVDKEYDGARKMLKEMPSYGLMSVIRPLMADWVEFAEKGKKFNTKKKVKDIDFFHSLLSYQLGLMADLQGEVDHAAKNYKKAVMAEQFVSSRAVMGYLNFIGRTQGAEAVDAAYDELLKKKPEVIATLRGSKDETLALLASFADTPMIQNMPMAIAEMFYIMGDMLHNDDMELETLLYLRLALRLNPDLKDAKYLLATVLAADDGCEQALPFYREITPQDGNYLYRSAQFGVSQCHEQAGDMDAAEDTLQILAEKYPTNTSVSLALGDLYRKVEKYEDAIERYDIALKLQKAEGVDKQWVVHYVRGIAQERLSNWELAEKDFESALEHSPNQPDVLNYLAYSWLDRGVKLEQAKEMLELAVLERPEDAHIVDSMGWAYFLLKDYDKAVEYLEQATDLYPSDPVINSHLGDALWEAGRKNEARFQWSKAIQFKPDDEALLETLKKKLEDGMYYGVGEEQQAGVEPALTSAEIADSPTDKADVESPKDAAKSEEMRDAVKDSVNPEKP